MARTTWPLATAEAKTAKSEQFENLADIGDDQRVAQIRLVGAVFQQ